MTKKNKLSVKSVKKRTFPKSRYLGKNILPILLLGLISVLFISGFAVFRSIQLPFAAANSPNFYDTRTENLVPVLIFSVDDLNDKYSKINTANVVFIDKISKKSINYELSPDLYVNTPGKQTEEKVANLYHLANLLNSDNQSESMTFIYTSISKNFRYPIKKYIVYDNYSQTDLVSLFSSSQGALINMNFISDMKSGHILTNISLSEFYELTKIVKDFSSDRFIKVSIENGGIDSAKLFTQLRDLSLESSVAYENMAVTVLNGTSVSGLAASGADVVENIGARVITVSNAKNIYDKTLIITDNPESNTVKKLSQYFSNAQIINKTSAAEFVEENEIYRSDIVLILGIDNQSSL